MRYPPSSYASGIILSASIARIAPEAKDLKLFIGFSSN